MINKNSKLNFVLVQNKIHKQHIHTLSPSGHEAKVQQSLKLARAILWDPVIHMNIITNYVTGLFLLFILYF